MISTISKDEKSKIRQRIFMHLDGWALIPAISELNRLSVLDLFLKQSTWSIKNINMIIQANEGYLNVALRALSSQGYLICETDNELDEITYQLTDTGKLAFKLANHYDIFFDLMKNFSVRPKNIIAENSNIEDLENAWIYSQKLLLVNKDRTIHRMNIHMEGILIGSILVGLGITKKLDLLDESTLLNAEKFELPIRTFEFIILILSKMDFISEVKNKYFLNAKGIYYLSLSNAYGVTISYLPTFANLNILLKGDPNKMWEVSENGHEKHVYRHMNVWGSGGAHKGYFKHVDKIIIDIFNQNIENQPKGIIDVGCGDGTLICHIYEIILTKTQRGKMLKTHPLFVIGIDFNDKAQSDTKDRLKIKKIKAEVEFGDISDPDAINEMLIIKYGRELGDLLNMRTFLDHNRIFEKPKEVKLSCLSEGSFAFRGRRLPNNEVFENLSSHFKRWSPYLRNHGLIIIELHSINPKKSSGNIGKTLSTAYESTHGYTDQYIIELPCFLNAIEISGLKAVEGKSRYFPNKYLATVSIQLLKSI
jgi:DNA-binding PadR family transcriptional regulator